MAMADLPPYSGLNTNCPKCCSDGILTEWHLTGGPGNPKMSGRTPPCEGRTNLGPSTVRGGHLCRLCKNCKHGWVEACADSASPGTAVIRPIPNPGDD